MNLKKLPIGISTLKSIIEEGYLYVDKTDIAQQLIENGRYYFLSRPRRFGKSLFLDTLRTIFNADTQTLKGLLIAQNGYEFKPYPVIRISFNDGDFSSTEAFNQTLGYIIERNQRELGIEHQPELTVSESFRRLIEEVYLKYNQSVVILIDEYDKPILDNIENTEEARKRRDELKNFYSVIKGADEYLKFVFITGVSKFSKVSLFSGLNNIEDITLDKRYATICGYTQNDIETVFKPYLIGQDFEKIRKWYNGYRFLGESVYNPFDILLFIAKGFEYRNYWFSTATPTFLLKILEKNHYFLPNLENVVKDERMLDSFDVDYIELETLMWQTGYLTIVKATENFDGTPKYQLAIPNQEVRLSLMGSIADHLSKIDKATQRKESIFEALNTQDFKALEVALKSLFAAIPYHLFTHNKMYQYEGYYVSVFYAYMKGLGFDLVAEDVTNKGRIDLTIMLPNAIFIIEFKTDGTNALAQIKDKQYHEKYLSKGLPIYLLGIEFETEARNITQLQVEKV